MINKELLERFGCVVDAVFKQKRGGKKKLESLNLVSNIDPQYFNLQHLFVSELKRNYEINPNLDTRKFYDIFFKCVDDVFFTEYNKDDLIIDKSLPGGKFIFAQVEFTNDKYIFQELDNGKYRKLSGPLYNVDLKDNTMIVDTVVSDTSYHAIFKNGVIFPFIYSVNGLKVLQTISNQIIDDVYKMDEVGKIFYFDQISIVGNTNNNTFSVAKIPKDDDNLYLFENLNKYTYRLSDIRPISSMDEYKICFKDNEGDVIKMENNIKNTEVKQLRMATVIKVLDEINKTVKLPYKYHAHFNCRFVIIKCKKYFDIIDMTTKKLIYEDNWENDIYNIEIIQDKYIKVTGNDDEGDDFVKYYDLDMNRITIDVKEESVMNNDEMGIVIKDIPVKYPEYIEVVPQIKKSFINEICDFQAVDYVDQFNLKFLIVSRDNEEDLDNYSKTQYNILNIENDEMIFKGFYIDKISMPHDKYIEVYWEDEDDDDNYEYYDLDMNKLEVFNPRQFNNYINSEKQHRLDIYRDNINKLKECDLPDNVRAILKEIEDLNMENI